MKNKQVIEKLNGRAYQAATLLCNDIDSGKPHMTVVYIKNQLQSIVTQLETQQQYLDLEE